MRLDIPADKDPLAYAWAEIVPKVSIPAAMFSGAVYEHATLPLPEFEAARLVIADVNGCLLCQNWRTERVGAQVPEDYQEQVRNWREPTAALSDRARLAAEYAFRFATDHHSLDDAWWERFRAHYSQSEIVELTLCIGSWVAFGRMNQVLGLDQVCAIPQH